MIRVFAIAAALAATTATAQETVGSLDGILDGVQVSYVIMDGEGYPTGWTETEDGIEVILRAFPSDSPQGDDDALTLTIVSDAASRQTDLTSGSVVLVQDGTELTSTDEAIDLSINSFEVSGDSLLIAANIRTTMSETDENVSVVAEDGRTLSADLQATVIRRDKSSD